jgi:hypothetical protein
VELERAEVVILNLKALEGVPCLAQMTVDSEWGSVKQWEGPFRLTDEGVLIPHYKGGYDGVRPWEGESGVLFRWARIVPGVPSESLVSFSFGFDKWEGSS